MSIYKIEDFTFGAELEIADVDTRIVLPEGNSWDRKDYTIANSCGVCNDPKKKITIFGGEINTKPTKTVEEQTDNIIEIFKCLGEQKSINHTCNLHIHVGVPNLSSDLVALKKLAKYIFENQEEAFLIVEELIEPSRNEYDSEEEYFGARKRFNRRKVSHQNKLSKRILELLLSSNSTEEFYHSFAPKDKNGKLQWQTVTRCGINMLQLFNETDTVEFRHFPMTFNPEEIESSIEWCKLFMDSALNSGKKPNQILKENSWMTFPKFKKYDHSIHKIFELTTLGKLSRKEVEKNINDLLFNNIITKLDLYGKE